MPEGLQPRPPQPGKGLLGLLGLRLGQIAKALTDPVHRPTDSNTIYRESKIEERPLPADPSVTLRRTVIDEVIVKKGSQNAECERPNEPSTG